MPPAEDYPQPVRRTFAAPEGDVSYLEWSAAPAGAPLMHFAHASGFNALTYRGLLGPAAGRLRILASDFRGHGFTTLPADPKALTSWLLYRDDLIRFLESLGEPVFLAGHSLGGTTSLLVAAARPDLVRGLVLLDPVLLPWRTVAFWWPMKLLGMGGSIAIARRAAQRSWNWSGMEEVLASYQGRGAFASWKDGFLADYLAGGTRTRPDSRLELTCSPQWEARTFAATPHDHWLQARKATCPMTVLYGGRSDTFTAGSAKQFSKTFPAARLERFDEASHFLPMEEPERVREEILMATGA